MSVVCKPPPVVFVMQAELTETGARRLRAQKTPLMTERKAEL